MMTDKELNDIVDKARNATSGPWVTNCNSVNNINGQNVAFMDTILVEDKLVSCSEEKAVNDAKYIAAVNPVVVIDLITELRKARQERNFLINQLKAAGIVLESSLDDVIKSLEKLKSEFRLHKIDWESMAEEYSND